MRRTNEFSAKKDSTPSSGSGLKGIASPNSVNLINPRSGITIDPIEDDRKIKVSTLSPTNRGQVPTAAAPIRPEPIAAAYYINPPLPDRYVWKRIAASIDAKVHDYDAHNSRSLFDAIPELRLGDTSTSASTVAGSRLLVNRLMEYYWHYVNHAMMTKCAFATWAAWSQFRGTGSMSRFNAAFKYGTSINLGTPMTDYPLPTGVEAYITKHTKTLLGTGGGGARIVALPIWAADVRGFRAAYTSGNDFGLGTDPVGTFLNTNLAALTKVIGVLPENRQGVTITASVMELQAVLDAPVPSSYSSDGYVIGAIKDMYTGWLARLQTNWADMRDPNSEIRKLFTQIVPCDDPSTPDKFWMNVRDNDAGDLVEFFTKYGVYGSRLQGTYGHILKYAPPIGTVDWSTYTVENSWLGNDASFAYTAVDYQHAYKSISGTTAYCNTLNFLGGAFSNVVGDLANNLTGYSALGKFQLEIADQLTNDDSANDNPGIRLFGFDENNVLDFLEPSDDPELFIVEAEKGYRVCIHQKHMPLINVWDPSQCGLYLLASYDSAPFNEWEKYVTAGYKGTATILNSAGTPQTHWHWSDDTFRTNQKDALIFMGDALFGPANLMQSRSNIGYLGGSVQLASLTGRSYLFSPAYPPVKPFTIPTPIDGLVRNDLELLYSDDSDAQLIDYFFATTENGLTYVPYGIKANLSNIVNFGVSENAHEALKASLFSYGHVSWLWFLDDNQSWGTTYDPRYRIAWRYTLFNTIASGVGRHYSRTLPELYAMFSDTSLKDGYLVTSVPMDKFQDLLTISRFKQEGQSKPRPGSSSRPWKGKRAETDRGNLSERTGFKPLQAKPIIDAPSSTVTPPAPDDTASIK